MSPSLRRKHVAVVLRAFVKEDRKGAQRPTTSRRRLAPDFECLRAAASGLPLVAA